MSDREKLLIVLRNLFDNSIAYAPQSSMVDAKIRYSQASCSIQITNQTMDLQSNDLPKLFDRFCAKIPCVPKRADIVAWDFRFANR